MRSHCRWLALGCLLSPALAQNFVPLVRPSHVGHPSAFDTVRRRLVMFDIDGTTWELDGADLLPRTRHSGGPQPTPRSRHAMCYDEPRRRVLMFGGIASGIIAATLGDTWAYDGSDWTELTGGPAPAARRDAPMTWDSTRNRAVLWGGADATFTLRNDTWEHDGSTWLQRSPTTSPQPRTGIMAFDRQRGVAVMVTRPYTSGQAETWEWDGSNWALRATSTVAGLPSGEATIAFDASRNRTVLAGHDPRIQEWNGATWTASAPQPQPFLRQNAASWFDPSCGCVTLAGGIEVSQGEQSDRWRWDGLALTQAQPNDAGPRAMYGMMLADPPRGRIIHFGGSIGSGYSAETRALANGIWSAVPSLTSPSARMRSAATHDLVRGESLLFGGASTAGWFGDTWSIAGAGWVARSTTGPSPRMGAAMAADLVRGVIVLFGGSGSGGELNDTWEWNGLVWTQRATVVQPNPRFAPAMAFHPLLGRVLLFGGVRDGVGLNDSWTWDGTHWTALISLNAPPPLIDTSMGYDLTSNQCTLIGAAGAPPRDRQVWRHDGSNWVHQSTTAVAAPSYPCALGPTLDTMICIGSRSPEVAELTFAAGRVASTGAGCGTPASTLQVRSRPRIGTTMGVELVANPNRAVLFALDLSSGSTALGGGCTLRVGASFVSTFQISSSSGFANQLLPVPANPALRGLDLFAQAAVLEPLSSNGLVLTQGLRLTLGD